MHQLLGRPPGKHSNQSSCRFEDQRKHRVKTAVLTAQGSAVIAIPGIFRLLLELGFFGAATRALFAVGAAELGSIYAVAVLIHYFVSYDRVLWLVQH